MDVFENGRGGVRRISVAAYLSKIFAAVRPHQNSATTTRSLPSPGRELVGIQYVRGAAALMVVLFHLKPQLEHLGYTVGPGAGLSGGVDAFFVISGLIMWITTCDRAVSPLKFLNHRLVRIVPLYWITTTIMVAAMVVAPSVLQTARFDLNHIIASYAFIAWPHPTSGFMQPVVFPGWTLNYEMFFYLIFSVLLLVRRSYRLVIAAVVFTALPLIGAMFQNGLGHGALLDSQFKFYTSVNMLEFFVGMLLGEVFNRTRGLQAIGPRFGLLLALIGLVLLPITADFFPDIPSIFSRGVPALLLVTGALACDSVGGVPRHWLPLLVGNASYSLYLMHPFVLSATSQLWRKLHLTTSVPGLWVFSILSVGLCLVVAALSFWLVETPLIAFFRNRRR